MADQYETSDIEHATFLYVLGGRLPYIQAGRYGKKYFIFPLKKDQEERVTQYLEGYELPVKLYNDARRTIIELMNSR